MRLASTPSRRAAGPHFLAAPLPAEPEPGSLRHIAQIIRTMPLDEWMSGVAFILIMAVAFLSLVVFS